MLIQAPDQHSPIYNPATLLWSFPSTWATKRFHAAQRIEHLSSVPFRNFFSQPLVNGTTLHFPTIRSLNSPLLSFLGGDDQLKCFKIVFLPSRKKRGDVWFFTDPCSKTRRLFGPVQPARWWSISPNPCSQSWLAWKAWHTGLKPDEAYSNLPGPVVFHDGVLDPEADHSTFILNTKWTI